MPLPKTPLPSFRVNCCYPFETTGLNYAGPLDANEGNDNKLRKCYILLFTSVTIRAVRLEITRDFSSKSLDLAIRRFIVRRSKPAFLLVTSSNLSNVLM